jgi:hypothetical protein
MMTTMIACFPTLLLFQAIAKMARSAPHAIMMGNEEFYWISSRFHQSRGGDLEPPPHDDPFSSSMGWEGTV